MTLTTVDQSIINARIERVSRFKANAERLAVKMRELFDNQDDRQNITVSTMQDVHETHEQAVQVQETFETVETPDIAMQQPTVQEIQMENAQVEQQGVSVDDIDVDALLNSLELGDDFLQV